MFQGTRDKHESSTNINDFNCSSVAVKNKAEDTFHLRNIVDYAYVQVTNFSYEWEYLYSIYIINFQDHLFFKVDRSESQQEAFRCFVSGLCKFCGTRIVVRELVPQYNRLQPQV